MFSVLQSNLCHMQPTKKSCITRGQFVLTRQLSVFLRCMPHSGWTQHFYFTDSLNTCTTVSSEDLPNGVDPLPHLCSDEYNISGSSRYITRLRICV